MDYNWIWRYIWHILWVHIIIVADWKQYNELLPKNQIFFTTEDKKIKSLSKLSKDSKSEELSHPTEKEIKTERYLEYLTTIVDSADSRIRMSILGLKVANLN